MSQDILLTLIDPDPQQPRKNFDPASLAELVQSMEVNGLAVPILLRPAGERYIIVHGERRYKAAVQLGWERIPAEVRELSPEEARRLSLIENVQRADLSPIEEARAYRSYLQGETTQAELGRWLGKTQSYIAQKLRLLNLPPPLCLYLDRQALTEGHARQLLKLKGIYPPKGKTMPMGDAAVEALGLLLRDYGLDRTRAFAEHPTLAFELFRDIRPEDNPPIWITPTHVRERPLLAEGCADFARYIGGAPRPLWEVGAFWWGSAVVATGMSVAALAQALDRWKECFYTAVLLGLTQDKPPHGDTPAGRLLAARYWGYRADLRHAGVRDYVQAICDHPEDYTERELAWLHDATGRGLFYLTEPSCLQPWGFQYEQHKDAMAADFGRRPPEGDDPAGLEDRHDGTI